MKIYRQDNQELIVESLAELEKLDNATYYAVGDNVIADAGLPTLTDHQTLIVSGERNADGHYTVSDNVKVVADYRSVDVYSTETGEKIAMKRWGDLPDNATLEPRPSEYHTFVGGRWTLTADGKAQQLADAKALKKVAVSQFRDTERFSPIEFENARFQGDEASQQLITSSITLFSALGTVPTGFVWRDADNVDHAFDLKKLVGLGAALAQRTNTLYARAWQVKAKIEAAKTLADLEKIKIEYSYG